MPALSTRDRTLAGPSGASCDMNNPVALPAGAIGSERAAVSFFTKEEGNQTAAAAAAGAPVPETKCDPLGC